MTIFPGSYVIQADATSANAHNIPGDVIAVMGYVTGTPDICWTQAQWDSFPLAGKLRVDQSPILETFRALLADVADIESGAADLTSFLRTAAYRETQGHHSTLYQSWGVNGANLDIARTSVDAAHLTEWVRYYVAEYSWSADQAVSFMDANPDVVAVQFATPESNPSTLMPGRGLTLAEAQCDLSVKRADWFGSIALAATAWQE